MLANWMPHTSLEAHSPIFRYGVRRIRWGSTTAALTRYTLVAGAIIFVSMFLLWLLVVLLQLPLVENCRVSSGYYCEGHVRETGAVILAIYFFASVAGGFLADFACLFAAMNSIRGRFYSNHWDLLRLTPMREEAIVDAEHAIVQVRAWRAMALVVGARISVIVMLGVHLVGVALLLGEPVDPVSWLGFDPGIWVVIFGLLLFTGVYIVEAYWRMRAVTAVGLWLTARFRSMMTTALAGLGALLGLWIAQWIVLGITSYVTSFFFFVEYLYPMCASSIVGGVIFFFYGMLRQNSLQGAYRRAFEE